MNFKITSIPTSTPVNPPVGARQFKITSLPKEPVAPPNIIPPSEGSSSGLMAGPLSVAAVPAQLGAKVFTNVVGRGVQKNLDENKSALIKIADNFLALATKEQDPVRKKDLIQKALEASGGAGETVSKINEFNKESAERQKIVTPIGDIPALADEPGRVLGQTAGRGLQTAAFTPAVGLTGSGALFGAGEGIEAGESPMEVAKKAALYAAGGKILGKTIDIASPVIGKAYKQIPAGIQAGIKATALDLAESRVGKGIGKFLEGLVPEKAETVGGKIVDTATKRVGEVLDKYTSPSTYFQKGTGSKVSEVLGNIFTTPGSEKAVNELIDDSFSKAIKPSISGKRTVEDINKYRQSAQEVVKDITENAGDLRLVDAEGNLYSGAPKTRMQVLDAVGQGKARIWKKVEEANTAAGRLWQKVDMSPVASELEVFAGNEVNRIADPAATRYAEELAIRLRNSGELTPEQAQQLLSDFNSKASTFWRNPNPNDLGKSVVDAMVANNTRTTLDRAIETVGGEAAKPYRNLYSSYSQIEKDIARAANRGANLNARGLIDMFDIVSAADMARAIVTLSPGDAATSVGIKLFKEWHKSLNNPDTILEKMFTKVGRAYQQGVLKPKVYPGFSEEQNAIFNAEKAAREAEALRVAEEAARNAVPPSPVIPMGTTDLRTPIPNATDLRKFEGGGVKVQDIKLPKATEIKKKVDSVKDVFGKAKEAVKDFIETPRIGLATEDVSSGASALGKKIVATGEQKPTLQLKRDVQVTTLSGEKTTIPADEVLKAYESGGKALLKDGREYVVSKSQYENIKNNSLKSEAKEFAPELKGTEETIKGGSRWRGDELVDNGEVVANVVKNKDGTWSYQSDFSEGSDTFKTRKEAMDYAEADTIGTYSNRETKYSSYQLPGGENYKEILIKTPEKWDLRENGTEKVIKTFDSYKEAQEAMMGDSKKYHIIPTYGKFKSSHWDEPNVISHIRLNERTYDGKKVTFMEELQSDWAREGRQKGFIGNESENVKAQLAAQKELDSYNTLLEEKYAKNVPENQKRMTVLMDATDAEKAKLDELFKNYEDLTNLKEIKSGIPNNPLLKNWQELSVKRALKEAVDNDSAYFAWINGEQTAARYNLSKEIDNINWKNGEMSVSPKGADDIEIVFDKTGKITHTTESNFVGKKLEEAVGKGVAEKALKENSGSLSGEGLNIGGEWAKNLYDSQVKNIVEDLTGAKVKMLDMKIEDGGNKAGWSLWNGKSSLKLNAEMLNDKMIGQTVIATSEASDKYIITDILGDGKFKVVSEDLLKRSDGPSSWKAATDRDKQIFDISTKKSVQQGIELTPEVKAIIKGEKPVLKSASEKSVVPEKKESRGGFVLPKTMVKVGAGLGLGMAGVLGNAYLDVLKIKDKEGFVGAVKEAARSGRIEEAQKSLQMLKGKLSDDEFRDLETFIAEEDMKVYRKEVERRMKEPGY